MSISTTATKDSYAGNNSIVTQYPITFKYFEESHISVYFDGVLQTKGAGADYVMGGDGTTSTGYITTNVAQAGTVTVAITLDVPFDQPVVLQETGSLPAKTIEVEGFDRLNMQVRRVWRKLGDVLTFSSDEGGRSTGTADNLIGFDGSGDIAEIPNTTFLQQDNNLSELANAPDQAAAQTNLNVDPAGTDNSTDVTKTGAGTYVSLAGQVLTVDAIEASDVIDFDAEVSNNTTVAANTSDRHVAATKSGTGTYVSLNVQDIVVDPIQDGDVDSEASTSGEVLKSDGASGAAWAKVEGTEVASTGEISGSKFLRENGDNTCSWIDLSGLGVGDALQSSPLSQFAPTTSLQLKNTITDETGTGALVFGTSPALVTPDLGTPSAVDLTNATNYPETNGTVQGTGVNTLNIRAADEGLVAGDARGESSVDLQMGRLVSDQVASGPYSAIIGGRRNKATGSNSAVVGGIGNSTTASDSFVSGNVNTNASPRGAVVGGISNDITGTGSNHAIVGGTQNEITATASHAGVFAGNNNTVTTGNSASLGGQRNTLGGANSVALGATDGITSAVDTLIAGGDATASHEGARVFGDTTATPIASIAANEFAIQGSALRLVDGNQGAGKVLTSDANGSGNWAALPVADTTTEGVVERATQEEVDAGTDTSRVVTPETLANYSGLSNTFKSGWVQCPAVSNNHVFAHGLGEVPDSVSFQLKAKTSGSGFVSGEIIIINPATSYNAYGVGAEVDTTNVTFHVGAAGIPVIAPDGVEYVLTLTNFEVKAIATVY